jgi:REP element-mobilizing transposase RayT
MARPLRIEFDGALYHVTARGNARQNIFDDDTDRLRFLDLLGEACARFDWRCHVYCLMGNHYHLGVETAAPNLGRGMRQLNGVYTQAFNRRHGRVGHLFQGRYKAILVERETYLLELCRYVVLNPVRAGLASAPGRWPWSSYRATVGDALAPAWLKTDWLLAQFGRSKAWARRAYEAFVAEGVGAPGIWENLQRQVFLGSEDFADAMQARIDGGRDLSEVPAIQRRPAPRPLDRYGDAAPDRAEAMARAYLSGGYSQAEIARHFGVHYSTVSRAVRGFQPRDR